MWAAVLVIFVILFQGGTMPTLCIAIHFRLRIVPFDWKEEVNFQSNIFHFKLE